MKQIDDNVLELTYSISVHTYIQPHACIPSVECNANCYESYILVSFHQQSLHAYSLVKATIGFWILDF